MKGKKDCKMNKGGKVNHEEKEEAKYHMKKGGKVHKAEGSKPKMNLAKRARGGSVSSPLSGAEPKGLPGGMKGQNAPCDKSND